MMVTRRFPHLPAANALAAQRLLASVLRRGGPVFTGTGGDRIGHARGPGALLTPENGGRTGVRLRKTKPPAEQGA